MYREWLKMVLFLLLIAVVFGSRAEPALAFSLLDDVCDDGGCTLCDVVRVIYNIGKFVFISMSAVAMIMFIWFGLGLIISNGSQEKVQQAKSGLLNTVIALVIILGAWTIVNTIGWTILGANQGPWKSWWNGPRCN